MITPVTPTSIAIKVMKYTDLTIGSLRELTLYVKGPEFKELPLDANVREPDPAKSKPYKDMRKTLLENPDKFFENNLGISVIATDVRFKRTHQNGEAIIELEFQHGTGILNGGHTQQAILDAINEGADLSRMLVRLSVRVSPCYSESRIAEIAAAQNSCTNVKEYSLAEKRGLFRKIKNRMSDAFKRHIIWYEGKDVGNAGIEPTDLIAYLTLFNVFAYSSRYTRSTAQPKECASNKGMVFSRWEQSSDTEEPTEFERIYPLVDDILRLMEFINLHFNDYGSQMARLAIVRDTKGQAKRQVFSGETPGYILPRQMLMPLLAAFRANVYYDDKTSKIGWCCNNEELFKEHSRELCDRLKTSFKAGGNNVNRFSKDPTIWENLTNLLQGHINVSMSRTDFQPFAVYSL